MNLKKLLLIATAGIIAFELKAVYIDRPRRRRIVFEQASNKAIQTNKKLIVIGDPHTDNFALDVDYGCGDLCIDINGCPQCNNAMQRDINNGFQDLRNNSYVVFISCTLEYTEDIYSVYNELMRISGGDLYIVPMEPYTLKTLFARNLGYSKFSRNWRILKSPPEDDTFVAERL